MKKLVILGSTGSIGTQALEIVAASEELQVVGLAAGSRWELALEQAKQHGVPVVALGDPEAAESARGAWNGRVLSGEEGIRELIVSSGADLILNGMVGAAGLGPTIVALTEGIDVALANKESLVIGGDLTMALAEATGARLLPVDSEHSALFQLIGSEPPGTVERLVLTASGGPFRGRTDLSGVTIEDALAHPTWAMGGRITIDCATLMNKGFEAIEAHHLFGVPYERIDVVVHPQSIVHSLIDLNDGATLAHLGYPDMKVPISYALHHPERADVDVPRLDLAAVGSLAFEEPDLETFACLRLALEAGREGGVAPCVLNAADEVAVAAFLDGRIGFTAIAEVIERVLGEMPTSAGRALRRPLRRRRRGPTPRRRAGWRVGKGMSWLLVIFGFCLLVVLHEAGHFFAAKATGMRVEKFFLFIGPKLVSFKRGETEYGIAAFPIGGYVKITGMNPDEELPPDVVHRGYYHQPVWKRIVVIGAGPAVNIALAFVILFGLYLFNAQNPTQTIGTVVSGSPASKALVAGDKLVAVDGHSYPRASLEDRLTRFSDAISSHRCAGELKSGCRATDPVQLTVARDGGRRTFTLYPTYDSSIQKMRIGVAYKNVAAPVGAGTAASDALDSMWLVTHRTASVFANIFNSQERKQVSGIVGVSDVAHQTVNVGLTPSLLLLALVSLSLGLINLLPFLPLDGGHIFWSLVEKVRGRPVSFSVMERASVLGFVLVAMLMFIGLSNDIGRLNNGGFHVR